jgi:cytochrome c oxidase cbb3-type subunit III
MHEPTEEMERHNRVPRGYLVLFFGLIACGILYLAAYTPEISGWSQYAVLEKEIEAGKRLAAARVLHENPYQSDLKAVSEGQILFDGNCAGCHGRDLKGAIGPDLTAPLAYGESDGAMYESVARGRPGGMPPFGDQLGRDRIWKVLAYVDSVRERPDWL